MKYLLILIAFLTTACANHYHRSTYNVYRDERVAFFLYDLEDYYGVNTVINIRIAPLHDEGKAVCDMRAHTITIDSEFYETASTDNLEEVVLHEFGHCLFRKDHYGVIIMHGEMHGCLSSVMHP